MSETMKQVGEDSNYLYFESLFPVTGQLVRISVDKMTNEILFNADDVAKCIGFENLEDMMQDDEVLDYYSESLKQGKPVLKKGGPHE